MLFTGTTPKEKVKACFPRVSFSKAGMNLKSQSAEDITTQIYSDCCRRCTQLRGICGKLVYLTFDYMRYSSFTTQLYTALTSTDMLATLRPLPALDLLLHLCVRETDPTSDFFDENASQQHLKKSRPLPIPVIFLPRKKLITTCQPSASTDVVSSNPSPCSLQWKYSNHSYTQLLQY